MENSCCRKAANWWADKIKEASLTSVQNIDAFKEKLSEVIFREFSKNPHMRISTYGHPSNLLSEIAFKTEMPATIPAGYEMQISYDTGVVVYNKKGELIQAFS